jgi:phage-related protein
MGYSTTDSNINISTPDWASGRTYKKYDIINGSNTSVFTYSSPHFFIPSGDFVVKDPFVQLGALNKEIVGYSKPFLLKDLSTGYCLAFETSSSRPLQSSGQPIIGDNTISNLPEDTDVAESIIVELELLSIDMTPIQPNVVKKIKIPINEYAKIFAASKFDPPNAVSQVFPADYFQPNTRLYNGSYHDGGALFARIKITKTADPKYHAIYKLQNFSLFQLDEHENDLYFYALEDHVSSEKNSPFFHLGGLGLDSDALLSLQPESREGRMPISVLSPTNWSVRGDIRFKTLFNDREVCLMDASSSKEASISTTMQKLEIGETYRVDISLNPVRETKATYSNFAEGEPNDHPGGGIGGQDYGLVWKQRGVVSGTWDDGGGQLGASTETYKAGYIVQHGGPYSTNYEAIVFEPSDSRTWDSARKLARAGENGYTSDLAVVLVPEQQTAFTNLIETLNARYSQYGFWIGLTDSHSNFPKGFSPSTAEKIRSVGRQWLWIDGTPLGVIDNSPKGLVRDAKSYSNSPYGATLRIFSDNTDALDPTTHVMHHAGLLPGDYTFHFVAESKKLDIEIIAIQPPATLGIFEGNNKELLGLSESLSYGDPVDIENCIRLNHISVAKEQSLWTRHFTPNPSYGSSIDIEADNSDLEFGDGYAETRPKNLNSVKIQASLNFDSRKDSETKAIIHFLENTQGYKKLKYRLPSPFNKLQSFVCDSFNHSYNDYDDNSLSVNLIKDDAFILNRYNDFLMPHPGDWKASTPYYANDFIIYQSKGVNGEVDSPTTRAFYYAFSESKDKVPSFNPTIWTKNHFFWIPSQNNSFNRESRKHAISMENDFVGRSSDGVYPNLLTLNLSFESRSDFEARAIMHFLTNKMGYMPFLFSLPEPYSNLKTEPLRDSTGNAPKIKTSGDEITLKGAPTTIVLEHALYTPSSSANPGHELLLKNQVVTVPSLPSNKNKFYINKPTSIDGALTLEVYNPFYSLEDLSGKELKIHVQQKAFYCDKWSMTYTSYDNNNVQATFKEVALAPSLTSEFIDIAIGDDENNQYIDLSAY